MEELMLNEEDRKTEKETERCNKETLKKEGKITFRLPCLILRERILPENI
jgi:hypothetical protein